MRNAPVDIARSGNDLVVLEENGNLHILNNAGVAVSRRVGVPFDFIDATNNGFLGHAGDDVWVFDERLEPVERWRIPDALDARGATRTGQDLYLISRTHLHRLP
jgi:hypothetical protein